MMILVVALAVSFGLLVLAAMLITINDEKIKVTARNAARLARVHSIINQEIDKAVNAEIESNIFWRD